MAHQHILGYLVLEESLEISGTDITKGDHTVLLHTHTHVSAVAAHLLTMPKIVNFSYRYYTVFQKKQTTKLIAVTRDVVSRPRS